MDTTTTASEGLAPPPIPVRPVLDFNVRLASSETIAMMLRMCEPGGVRHMALLDEQRRRRRAIESCD